MMDVFLGVMSLLHGIGYRLVGWIWFYQALFIPQNQSHYRHGQNENQWQSK
jgi:hypothetical protein